MRQAVAGEFESWVKLPLVMGFMIVLLAIEVSNHSLLGLPRPRGLVHSWVSLAVLWQVANFGGITLSVLPFLIPQLRRRAGTHRRLLAGFFILIVGGFFYVVLLASGHRGFTMSLQLASALLAGTVLFVELDRRWRLVVFVGIALLALSAYATGHSGLEILSGALFGAVVYALCFGRNLDFLDEPSAWAGIHHKLRDVCNVFLANDKRRWERMYVLGGWDFLQSSDQRPRHYVISGVIHDRFPQGAKVLDVGCGSGVLYECLRGWRGSYTGIDIAEPVIRECICKFRDDADCCFDTVAFEDFRPTSYFDVVVLNEVLYYFRIGTVQQVFKRAQGLLRERGLVVVSMTRNNLKAPYIWCRLSEIEHQEQTIKVSSLARGPWTVRVYGGAKPSSARSDTEVLR